MPGNNKLAYYSGTDTTGNIESSGDPDYFKFIPDTSGMYAIETTGTTNTYGALYNSAQTYLKSNDNAGAGSNFYIVANLTAGQLYYVIVQGYSSTTGQYALKVNQLADEHCNDIASATAIEIGTDNAGEITYTQDYDYFKFTTTVNGPYIIQSTGTTDTMGYLFDSSGRFASNYDISFYIK